MRRSIWQALWARDAGMRPAEPTAPPRKDQPPAPSLKVLHEIFRPPTPARQEEPVDTASRVPQHKEAQVP
jgi:hypothetical protein